MIIFYVNYTCLGETALEIAKRKGCQDLVDVLETWLNSKFHVYVFSKISFH